MTNVSVQLNSTTTAYSYVVNGGEQDHNGFEASLKYAVVKDGKAAFVNVTPFINFAYSDFKYKNFQYKSGSTTSNIITYDYSGLNVFGVPKIAATWGIDAALKIGLYANVYHSYKDGVNIGYETISGVNYLRSSESYNIVNGKIGFRKSLNSHFDIDAYMGVDNITGTKFPYMIFVNQLPDAYLPAPLNANTYGGLNVKFNF
jgi:iron complex outermembrane receptor protein